MKEMKNKKLTNSINKLNHLLPFTFSTSIQRQQRVRFKQPTITHPSHRHPSPQPQRMSKHSQNGRPLFPWSDDPLTEVGDVRVEIRDGGDAIPAESAEGEHLFGIWVVG
jgi:hypothetical protein